MTTNEAWTWRQSDKGNWWAKIGGHAFVVYRTRRGEWGLEVAGVHLDYRWPNAEATKAAAEGCELGKLDRLQSIVKGALGLG